MWHQKYCLKSQCGLNWKWYKYNYDKKWQSITKIKLEISERIPFRISKSHAKTLPDWEKAFVEQLSFSRIENATSHSQWVWFGGLYHPAIHAVKLNESEKIPCKYLFYWKELVSYIDSIKIRVNLYKNSTYNSSHKTYTLIPLYRKWNHHKNIIKSCN